MDSAAVTAITSQVDFATVVTGIGAVGAGVVILLITLKGVKALYRAVGG